MKIMEVRPDVRIFLEYLNATPLRQLEALSVEQARNLMEEVRAATLPLPHDLAIVRDLTFEHAGITLRLRFYDACSERGPGPAIIYYHGGGFVLGNLDSHHGLCVQIARTLRVPLISVDYRLAPEHPWPAAPDDAEAAARWLARNARTAIGCEVTSLVLAGDSAGANLAAVTARALSDVPAEVPVSAQLLIYPCTAGYTNTRSRTQFADGLFLTKNGIAWFFHHYSAPARDARFELLAGSHEDLPPTVLVTAGLDPLRDEGRAYAAALVHAGTPVIFQEAKGNIHGCFGLSAAIPSSAQDVSRALHALQFLLAHRSSELPQ